MKKLGFDKSNPVRCSKPSKAEPVSVRAKLTINWIVSLLSFPNIIIETIDDKTNIQANEHMKTTRLTFEPISEAKAGKELPSDDVKVVKADCVKI